MFKKPELVAKQVPNVRDIVARLKVTNATFQRILATHPGHKGAASWRDKIIQNDELMNNQDYLNARLAYERAMVDLAKAQIVIDRFRIIYPK